MATNVSYRTLLYASKVILVAVIVNFSGKIGRDVTSC